MTQNRPDPGCPSPKQSALADRRAEALRANLKKRKEQSNGRDATETEGNDTDRQVTKE